MFFRPTKFLLNFSCWIFIRAPLWSLLAEKSASFGFFEKLLEKVQSIGCLDFIFSSQKWIFWSESFGCIFLRIFIRASIVITFSRKKVPVIWQFFRKVARKSTVYRLSRFAFFRDQKRFFFHLKYFWFFACRIIYQSSIVITFSQKKCFFGFFEKLRPKSTVYRLSRFTFLSPKMFFQPEHLFVFSCRIFIRAPLWTLLAEKSASFRLFSKSCSKKYSL